MPRPWSIVDFVLVILGGYLGAGVFLAVSLVFGQSELILVGGFAAEYLGHLMVFWLIARGKDNPDIGFQIEARDGVYLALGLLMQLVLAIVFFPLTSLLLEEGDWAQEVANAIAALETRPAQIVAIVVAVVLVPVAEEIAFRGVLLRALSNRRPWVVMVVTSVMFALFHTLGLDPGQFLSAAAVVLPQLFVVGLALAWVTIRSGRLGPAIFLHSGFNLLVALALLIPEDVLQNMTGG